MPRLRRNIVEQTDNVVTSISSHDAWQLTQDQVDAEFKAIAQKADMVLRLAVGHGGITENLDNPHLSTNNTTHAEMLDLMKSCVYEFRSDALFLVHYIINTDNETYRELSRDEDRRYVTAFYKMDHKGQEWCTEEQHDLYNLGKSVALLLLKTVEDLEQIIRKIESPQPKSKFFSVMRKHRGNLDNAKHEIISTLKNCFRDNGVFREFCYDAEFPVGERHMSSASVDTRRSSVRSVRS